MADFVFKRGTTFLVTLIWRDQSGTPVDMSRVRMSAELRDCTNTLIAPLDCCAVPDQPGTYTLSFAGDTSFWPLTVLRTDVQITSLNGLISQTQTLTISVIDRVTQ
ncbi:hypothetical protein [Acetobacter cibinongensis]|uniref:Uncharacterized protein n=1 Tax=Acetobacter cibinongensis TaxID=146475 RepID=A0A1Z5YR75_9PROT|nr:hypothetical protein [Acetobacter cibinongensis]OUI98336.1 hypothetical protein HK14_15660 [Acetobacter cibinongensis]